VIGAVDDERTAHAKFAERARHELREAGFVHADYLRGGAGGIGERAEQVEHSAHTK